MENLLEAVQRFNEKTKRRGGDHSLDEMKISYSRCLERERNLEAYLDDLSQPREEREKRVSEFKEILCQLNKLIAQIRKAGYPMTTNEILDGFGKTHELECAAKPETRSKPIAALTLPQDFELTDEMGRGFDLIEQTSECLFITGEAGTGKTTLLAYWRQNTKKNFIVLAPTGIAAVNSGGQTIHSFFKFPPSLIRKEHIRKLPRIGKILKNLDTLIVDEASMMRADLLDGIDHALRLNRNCPNIPFGGVQIILFGDLFQLPPIIDKELNEHYGEIYDSPYFFSAEVFRQ